MDTSAGAAHGDLLGRRRAGVLLHLSSLPMRRRGAAAGVLGESARRWLDWMAQAGFAVWQLLPVHPVHADGSPYHARSAFAADPRWIDLDALVAAGWLQAAAVDACEAVPAQGPPAESARLQVLALALKGFERLASPSERERWTDFVARAQAWLEDHVLFEALRVEQDGAPWWLWPESLRGREPKALLAARERHGEALAVRRFAQFLLEQQWQAVRQQARERGIRLLGDVPIYVAHDSAETWAHPGLFTLDADGQAQQVAGVPPDYFSATGQRWGNPLYRWEVHQADGFAWWQARLKRQFDWFDWLRIDHFRGLAGYWAVPAGESTAMHGSWLPGPGAALLQALANVSPGDGGGALPLVAEDLGVITPDVDALRQQFGLPGMKILQFAFDGNPGNPYLPFNVVPDSVVFTGTHDNDTSLGWFESLEPAARESVREYLGLPGEAMPWPLIRQAWGSVARLALVPMQDLLALGSEARMNRPGTASGNWHWRCDWSALTPELAHFCHRQLQRYGRL